MARLHVLKNYKVHTVKTKLVINTLLKCMGGKKSFKSDPILCHCHNIQETIRSLSGWIFEEKPASIDNVRKAFTLHFHEGLQKCLCEKILYSNSHHFRSHKLQGPTLWQGNSLAFAWVKYKGL